MERSHSVWHTSYSVMRRQYWALTMCISMFPESMYIAKRANV